jgi:hypothetical protein
MDAAAQLALMTKAKIVFEKPGTFLSFPVLSPISYPPDVLDFGKALADPKTSAALLEFSRTVNQCPGGVIFQGDSDQYLWEHYDHWLNAMDLAQDGLAADQGAVDAQAAALLTVADANGLPTDSPALATYKQWRDRYIATEQAYKNAQVAASLAQDPAAKAQWQNTDEPQLRQAAAAAMADWIGKGNKVAIEAAQAEVASCKGQMPRKAWIEWRAAFNPDLDLFTDAGSNTSCGPSGFAPADILSTTWPTFTLGADEIHGLVGQAPKELQAIFGDTGTSTITSISFEFRSAAVVRTWFDSAVFDTRFWKFDGGLPDLSDGATPPAGAWPTYVTAVVFARNIRMTTAAAPQTRQPVRAMPGVVFRPEVMHALQAQTVAPTLILRPKMTMMAHPAMSAAVAPHLMIANSEVLHAATIGRVPAPVVPARAVTMNPALRMNAAIYRSQPIIAFPPVTAQSPPAITPPPADDKISILAFICRSLPKAPNPDPALHW